MDMTEIRRMILEQHEREIGGIRVMWDNAAYVNGNGAIRANVYLNTGYFLTGPYDTGTTNTKAYAFPGIVKPDGNNTCIRFFNDLSGTSYDYYGNYGSYRIVQTAGRYVTTTVRKEDADDFYVYDYTNQMFLCRGSNVPDMQVYGGLTLLHDNAVYIASQGKTSHSTYTSDDDYFVAGFYDTGVTSGSHSYTITTPTKYAPADAWCTIQFFNNVTSTAYDYWSLYGTSRTFSSGGRFVAVGMKKTDAPNMYMYDNTAGRYIYKGSNVT